MAGPGRRRSNGELARDRRIVADLYLKGQSQFEIAEVIGRHQTTVSNDIKALQRQWLQDANVDFDEARSRELGKIDHLEREAWLAYLRSQEDEETDVHKNTRWGEESSFTAKGQAGDPRFLAIVDKCINRRCKILGLDAPQRRELSGPGGSPLIPSDNVLRIIVYDEEDDDSHSP